MKDSITQSRAQEIYSQFLNDRDTEKFIDEISFQSNVYRVKKHRLNFISTIKNLLNITGFTLNDNNVEEVDQYYNAVGYVLGNMWGGGTAIYESESFYGYRKLDTLKRKIRKKVKDGTIDSGFGFESVIGARMKIERIKLIRYNNSAYKNVEENIMFFGKLNKQQQELLSNLT